MFPDQWDSKSPWHDRRVRLAANLAIDRNAINQAETLGFSKITWSVIPSTFESFWQPPAYIVSPRMVAESTISISVARMSVMTRPPVSSGRGQRLTLSDR